MKTIRHNVKDLDNKIGELLELYESTEDDVKRAELMDEIKDLTDIRSKLNTSKVEDSNSSLWVSGALSIATVVLIMKYEETDIITSKAFNIATRIFKN